MKWKIIEEPLTDESFTDQSFTSEMWRERIKTYDDAQLSAIEKSHAP
jgi:hypothetical protein